jgi:hypothetical protein
MPRVPTHRLHGHQHLITASEASKTYLVLKLLQTTGQPLTAKDIEAVTLCDMHEVRAIIKRLLGTGLVLEDRTYWPPRLSWSQERFDRLNERMESRPHMGYLLPETVAEMGENHPLKSRVFPCPGNLVHPPLLQDHFHLAPSGVDLKPR